MIIDMHTHIFPDHIAASTIKQLTSTPDVKAFTAGTLEGLSASMRMAGISSSVILPVVTNPNQFHSVNRFAAQITDHSQGRIGSGIISFGGIHPDSTNYKQELLEIKSLGLKGIKLHPDYQKTQIDDLKYIRIIDFASELGLIISVHAGVDIGLPSPVHCTPKGIVNLLKHVQPQKLILAHLGGFSCWDQVESLLVGRNIYMDLAYVFHKIDKSQLVRIIRNHGTKKIFFATDSPWSNQKADAAYFKTLPFNPAEFDQMLFQNALDLGIYDNI